MEKRSKGKAVPPSTDTYSLKNGQENNGPDATYGLDKENGVVTASDHNSSKGDEGALVTEPPNEKKTKEDIQNGVGRSSGKTKALPEQPYSSITDLMKEAHLRKLQYLEKITFNVLFKENVYNLSFKKKSSDGSHNDMLSLKVPKGLKGDDEKAIILMIHAQLVENKFSGVENLFKHLSMDIPKELMYKSELKLVKQSISGISDTQEFFLDDENVVEKIFEKMKELGENGKVLNLVFNDFDNCQQLLQQKPELLKNKENLFFVLFYAETLKRKIERVFKHLKSLNIKINVLSVECKSLKDSADFCMANVGAALDFRIGDRKKLCSNLKWFCLSGDKIFQEVTSMLNNVELLPNPHFGLQPVWQCLNRLNNICFSKDGSYFAIISPESVSVIKTRNGNDFCKIHQTDAQSVALSPLGSYLAILGEKKSDGFPVNVYYVKENRYLVKTFHIKQIRHWRPQFSNDEKNCLLYEEEESNEKMKFYRVSSTDFELLRDFDLPDDCTEFSFFGKNSTYTLALLRNAKIYEEEISVLTLLDPTEHNTKGNSCLQLGYCGPMQMFGNCLGTCLLLMSLNGSKKLEVAIRPLNDESDEWTMSPIDVGGIILNVQWSSGGEFFCVKTKDSLKLYNLKAQNILTLTMNKYTNCDLYIKDEHLYEFLCTSSDKIQLFINRKPISQKNMDVSYPIVAARLCDNGNKVFIVTSNQDILTFESHAIVLPQIKTKITLNLIGRSRPNANKLIYEFMKFVGKKFISHIKTSPDLKCFTFDIRRDMMTKARDFTFRSYGIEIKQCKP